jgi:putative GTP pyrophosphokinase
MESIYGNHLPEMQEVMKDLLERIQNLRTSLKERYGEDPIEHCLARIKSEDSMREKCRRKGLPETEHSALEEIHDGIGLRIVCAFVSDVYEVRDYLEKLPQCAIMEEKDYIKHAKPNGYRSLHLILRYRGYYAEIQLRTISMDTWAALEHQLKYKKNLSGNLELITSELKRCADELAATDMSMQTLRNMIYEEDEK